MWKRTITTCMAVAAITFAGSAAWAAAPSDAAIDELLEVMRLREQTSSMLDAMNQEFAQNASMFAQESGAAEDAAVQQRTQTMQQQMGQILREEMAWEKVRPVYRQVYKESLTAEEVAGMLAFYRTPVGQSVLQKQPQITERAMQISREQILPNVIERISTMTMGAGSAKGNVKGGAKSGAKNGAKDSAPASGKRP